MPHHRLPAGTDVAEVALFDVDALPKARPPDREGLAQLASAERLVRLPTGADGGYLLHLYVDEVPPARVMSYCVTEDKLTGRFSCSGGRIAFGGVESTFQDFKPNRNIRSDARIAPGTYVYTALHTEIPDEIVTEGMRVERTAAEQWLDWAPVIVVLSFLVLAFVLATLRHFVLAGAVLVAGYFAVKAIARVPAYKALVARREQAQLEFPSIVIEMRSAPGNT